MLWFGLVLAAIGGFFAFFGGINDGLWAGVKLFLVPGFVAAALIGASFAFQMAARAHARLSAKRWGIQMLAVGIAIVGLMLAMQLMSLLDRVVPA